MGLKVIHCSYASNPARVVVKEAKRDHLVCDYTHWAGFVELIIVTNGAVVTQLMPACKDTVTTVFSMFKF